MADENVDSVKSENFCFIRFQDSFDGGAQHNDIQIDERQNSVN